MSTQPELFISYKREPASTKLARELKEYIKQHFPWVKVKMDETEIRTGGSIKAYMDRLTKGNYIIFLLSPGFLESPWCMYELALTADYVDFRERVFQVRFPGVEIETAGEVAQITKVWQQRWKALKADMEEIASGDPSHLVQEFEEELRIASEIVKGSGRALLHMRETIGVQANVEGDLNLELMGNYLKGWIKLPSPIQKLLEDMVLVQSGDFLMGSDAKGGNANEKPVHKVCLSDYYIGKYLVTQAQWEAVMGKNPSRFPGCPDCPVERVSWEGCQEFIVKLNKMTGLSFNLPTEAQWEFAARGGRLGKGQNYQYSGGNDLDAVAWYGENSEDKSHPVGSKMPNALGLYDMSGNTWEWCRDQYDANAYQQFAGTVAVDPLVSGEGEVYVLRGGGWISGKQNCRVTVRCTLKEITHDGVIGLRLQRD